MLKRFSHYLTACWKQTSHRIFVFERFLSWILYQYLKNIIPKCASCINQSQLTSEFSTNQTKAKEKWCRLYNFSRHCHPLQVVFPALTAVTVLCSELWLVCSATCGNAADIQEEIVDCIFYRNKKTEVPSRFLFAISADALFLLKGHVTYK